MAEAGSNSWWNSGRRVWPRLGSLGHSVGVPSQLFRAEPLAQTLGRQQTLITITLRLSASSSSAWIVLRRHIIAAEIVAILPLPRILALHFLLSVSALLCIRLRDFLRYPFSSGTVPNEKHEEKKYLICMQPRAPYFSLISPSKCVYGKIEILKVLLI